MGVKLFQVLLFTNTLSKYLKRLGNTLDLYLFHQNTGTTVFLWKIILEIRMYNRIIQYSKFHFKVSITISALSVVNISISLLFSDLRNKHWLYFSMFTRLSRNDWLKSDGNNDFLHLQTF